MRIRIKFTKNEMVKYLGHLDIMRAFQRFFNCAHVKMEYSAGFNPHQKMHFALPLGVGITSKAEYLDAQVSDGQNPDIIRDNLNNACKGAFDVLSVKILKEDAPKAMASVQYASYSIRYEENWDLYLEEYLSRDAIILQKKTKTGIRDVDVKAALVKLSSIEQGVCLLMRAGGADSIKPELVFADLMAFHQIEYERDQIRICREELYGPDFIPLEMYGTIGA